MADRYVLVIDLGSSSLRAHPVPVDQPWAVPPGAVRHYGSRRQPGALAHQLHPARVRERLFDAMREALHSGGIEASAVAAIAVTAQRGGTAFLDGLGRTLYLGPNKDVRAVFEGAEIDERWGQEIYSHTGHLPSLFFPAAKLRWWRNHQPRQADAIDRVLTLGAWAVHELTGETAETGPSLAEAGMADINAFPATVPGPLLQKLGVESGLLPQLLPTGTPSGGLCQPAAQVIGLLPGIPVCLVGPDAQAAMLGMGLVEPGSTGVTAGWSAPVERVTKAPVLHPARKTWASHHIIDGRWIAEANASDTGETVEAVRRLLRLPQARFTALAERAPQPSPATAAFWGPRALDLSAPGMSFGGLLLPVPVTHEGLEPGALALATLENVAFAIRECVDMLDELAAPSSAPVSLSGGMAADPVFVSILAAVLGGPLLVHGPKATVTGAAIAASRPPQAWEEAADAAVGQGSLREPNAGAVLAYGQAYGRWRTLRDRLDELTEAL
ncbi:MAG: FGGY-family carbohydrate kinase [Dehalococcoidia bacterium]